MENRTSWQSMAVSLFDKATAKLGEDARQLQDAMFWRRRVPDDVTLRSAVERDLDDGVEPGNPCQSPVIL
ncbi:MAG: hypothetical protein RLZZ403_1130 [Pseudomonadota bacterium]|jgi:hypothetical protein